MKIIDTHQHLWDLSRFPYSWCEPFPLLNKSFLPEDYARAITEIPEGYELAGSVHVEADVDEPHQINEVRWLEEVAATPGNPIKALVAAARPEWEDFPAQLEALAVHPLVRGIRRVLHVAPDEVSQSALFAANLRRMPTYNYTFDLVMRGDQLPLALNIVRQCPETAFVLDHCGNPSVQEPPSDNWREGIKAIAAHPNVVCKVSGIIASANPESWTVADLRPFVEFVIESFGWDRVLWGSDWPVCLLAAGYGSWLSAALEITQGESSENRQKLFHDNACRVYRLAEG